MATPYRGIPNTFRDAMRARQRLIGCWLSIGHPITAEIIGLAGFDWLLLDGEHAINDVTTFVPQLMALKDSPSAPVVRPPWNEPVIIKRLLDAGFYNFLIPFVETAEDAARAVAATRYPPAGIRGVAVGNRHNRYGTIPDYFKIANDHVCVLVQIESRKGLANVDAIAGTEGVDGVFVGPSDLAAGFGYLGQHTRPEVQDAIRHIFARVAAAGKASGILTSVEAENRRYMEWGASFVAVGSDIGVLRAGSQALRDIYRK